MAFSDAEKSSIRSYLGYPSVNRSSDVTLEGSMTVVEGDASAEALVRALLSELADIDATLAEARGRLKVSQVEEIRLAGPTEVRALREEGKRLTARLGRVFDVKPQGAAWGGRASGYVRRA